MASSSKPSTLSACLNLPWSRWIQRLSPLCQLSFLEMPEIQVFDLGQRPIVHDGWPVPWDRGSILWYEVSGRQAERWNSLSNSDKRKLIRQAEQESRDLRELL